MNRRLFLAGTAAGVGALALPVVGGAALRPEDCGYPPGYPPICYKIEQVAMATMEALSKELHGVVQCYNLPGQVLSDGENDIFGWSCTFDVLEDTTLNEFRERICPEWAYYFGHYIQYTGRNTGKVLLTPLPLEPERQRTIMWRQNLYGDSNGMMLSAEIRKPFDQEVLAFGFMATAVK